jgi:hypothetical protein
LDHLRNGKFNGGFFVSFDAVELYPSIIIEDALDILERKIQEDKNWSQKTDLSKKEVIQLVRLLVSSPYFQCEFGFFKQTKGTPMGGPLSRLFADLIIENKIERLIQTSREWRRVFNWVRLVDDTFMNWTDSSSRLDEFFKFLNSLYPPIKWTMEIEKEGIPFNIFDIKIIRNDTGLETTIYRKPTSSDRYLHYSSQQSWQENVQPSIH